MCGPEDAVKTKCATEKCCDGPTKSAVDNCCWGARMTAKDICLGRASDLRRQAQECLAKADQYEILARYANNISPEFEAAVASIVG